ncbi:MAG: hypothetical protein L6Q98_07420 [Anaerolineae bacterium]|nr:hypothetical protein [Anaerolineae bacterium]NUQ04666.1 hypothetical protein [Anaerolineae bacterium]
MILTRQTVSDKLLEYLNQHITLADLVDWAENTFVDGVLEPDEDVDLLNDILGYLAAADTAQFPLTWDVCADFLDKLGVKVQVVAVRQAS